MINERIAVNGWNANIFFVGRPENDDKYLATERRLLFDDKCLATERRLSF